MSTNTKLAEALRLARDWFRYEEAGEGPQAEDVIKAADEALAAHNAEQVSQAKPAPAQAVPAGWKPVPVEPTPEMVKAGASEAPLAIDAAHVYRTMLAAAPAAPAPEAQAVPAGLYVGLIERLMRLSTRLGIANGDSVEHFAASLEDRLYAICRSAESLIDSLAPAAPEATTGEQHG